MGTVADINRLPSGIVTFVFTDIEGSTRLLRRLGERYAAVLDRHRDLLHTALQRHGGFVVETEGDAVFAAFTDAGAAVAACAAGQRALVTEAWPSDGTVRVRMGVHSGLAYPRGNGYVALAVHQASRIVAAAHGGQVLVSEQTAAIAAHFDSISLASVGRFRLRDFDEPVNLFQVSGHALPSSFPAVRALPAEGHNLVRPPTSFIGRDEILGAVAELLGPGRLVSVVGPGGVGKTRLVTELGLQIAPAWPDGVWFIDLSPLQDAALIPAIVATAVGCPVAANAEPWPAVLDHLRKRHALLIFDNCEQLIDGAAHHIADLQHACADVGVLATSREPLGLGGEQVWRLAPLATTGNTITAAAQLFAARARAVQPTFVLDAVSTPIVTAICNRLDGLPLAIELAAARVSVLSPTEILAGLEDRFRMLRNRDRTVSERQRTLQGLLDWSYHLLSADEQAALRRLGVFAGSFGLDTARAALAGGTLNPYDVPELVWSLAEKSLLSVEPTANATRYRLFDSIRAYALRVLDETNEAEATTTRLADWYLEQLGPWVPATKAAISLKAAEIDNLRGLIGMPTLDQPRALRLACSIAKSHLHQGTMAKCATELRTYLAQLTDDGPDRVALMCALVSALVNMGESAAASSAADAAAALAQAVGAPSWDSTAVESARAFAAMSCGDSALAIQILQIALPTVSDDNCRAGLFNQLYLAASDMGDMRNAYDAAQAALALDLKLGLSVAVHLNNLAEEAYGQRNFAAAARYQRDALVDASQTGQPVFLAFSMILAARFEAHDLRWATAARLHANADSVLGQLGVVMYESDRKLSVELLQNLRERLGNERYEHERQIGEQLTLPDAIALADTVLQAAASTSAISTSLC